MAFAFTAVVAGPLEGFRTVGDGLIVSFVAEVTVSARVPSGNWTL